MRLRRSADGMAKRASEMWEMRETKTNTKTNTNTKTKKRKKFGFAWNKFSLRLNLNSSRRGDSFRAHS